MGALPCCWWIRIRFSSDRSADLRPVPRTYINHSFEDGLFAEEIGGAGFEGTDFQTYWTSVSERGAAELADVECSNGKRSVRLRSDGGRAVIRQQRIFVEDGRTYDGSAWVRREQGT